MKNIPKSQKELETLKSFLLEEANNEPSRVNRINRMFDLISMIQDGGLSAHSPERKEFDSLGQEMIAVRLEILNERLDKSIKDHEINHISDLKNLYGVMQKDTE